MALVISISVCSVPGVAFAKKLYTGDPNIKVSLAWSESDVAATTWAKKVSGKSYPVYTSVSLKCGKLKTKWDGQLQVSNKWYMIADKDKMNKNGKMQISLVNNDKVFKECDAAATVHTITWMKDGKKCYYNYGSTLEPVINKKGNGY